jgi:hypothetical protein
MNRQICPIPTGKKETIGKVQPVHSASRHRDLQARNPRPGPDSFKNSTNPRGRRLARLKLKGNWKAHGSLKSLRETKEKSGNEAGRTNQPHAPSIFVALSFLFGAVSAQQKD